jgi:hypothetical protein
MVDRDTLIELFRELDGVQKCTDAGGGREVAWYYMRDDFEDAMGLERGSFNVGNDEDEIDCDAYMDSGR